MMDKVILWLMKRLILLWDRHGDKMAHQFEKDERTSYALLVERFYDDYFTFGTATMHPRQHSNSGRPVVWGKWEDCTEYNGEYRCSVCKEFEGHKRNFCPNCGAKMDGVTDD